MFNEGVKNGLACEHVWGKMVAIGQLENLLLAFEALIESSLTYITYSKRKKNV